MNRRSLGRWRMLAGIAAFAGFFAAAPYSLARQPALRVGLADTGKTIALSVGQQLIVNLPLQRRLNDDTWRLASNSGSALKLISGPDERRPANWTPLTPSVQVFRFQRESPGKAHLVLERTYWAKPMILNVVDR